MAAKQSEFTPVGAIVEVSELLLAANQAICVVGKAGTSGDKAIWRPMRPRSLPACQLAVKLENFPEPVWQGGWVG